MKNPFAELVPVRFVANLLLIDRLHAIMVCVSVVHRFHLMGKCWRIFNSQAIMEADSEAVEDCFPKNLCDHGLQNYYCFRERHA